MAPPYSRRHVPMPLMDELVEEILLRLPPDDLASLLRAALVSKRWCRLVSSPAFHRRFREFHRRTPPPLLGFFCHTCDDSPDTRFIPAAPSSFRLPHAVMPNWRAVDAVHGRVLFYDLEMTITPEPAETVEGMAGSESVELHLIVWNPITKDGEVSRLPVAPLLTLKHMWSAALLCDHVDSDAFRVVVVATFEGFTCTCVYSSEQHAWSTPVSTPHLGLVRVSGGRNHVLVGNALYLMCDQSRVLEYDMCRQQLSLISLPSACKFQPIALMTAEGGGLGFAMVHKSKLYIWSREAGLDGDGRWAQQRVFELDNLLPLSDLFTIKSTATRVLAVLDAFSAILIGTFTGYFVVDFKFGRATKVYEASDPREICDLVPYTSFCTPQLLEGASIDDEGPMSR